MASIDTDKALIAIANNRLPKGRYGAAVRILEGQGLVTSDPEWSGCLALTDDGWHAYEMLTWSND